MPGKSKQQSGVKLSQLHGAVKTISVPFAGAEIEVTFRTGFWTCRREREYLDGEGRFAEKNARLILENVVSWNITDDDGNPLKISAETVESMDAWLLDAIVGAMIQASNPNAQSSQA